MSSSRVEDILARSQRRAALVPLAEIEERLRAARVAVHHGVRPRLNGELVRIYEKAIAERRGA